MYDPIAIANVFIRKGNLENKPVTPMQVLKLVYISFGWYLALSGKRLFEESIEAWTHGPVVPSVYHKFKIYGRKNITEPAALEGKHDFHPLEMELLNKIWEKYSSLSGLELSNITHQHGTPWSEAIARQEKYLSLETIKSHYRKLAGLDEKERS